MSSRAFQLNGISETLKSFPSGLAITLITIAQSSAYRHIGPSRSWVQESAMTPFRLIRPNVGRKPVTPHRPDGLRIAPLVSVPIANATHPPAVADPGPAEDPLDPCSVFQGFLVCPPNQLSPCASSPEVSFASSTAPAKRSISTTLASSLITWSLYAPDPQVVLNPFTAIMSFAPQGIPCSGPLYRPAAISASASLACAIATSSRNVTTQLSLPLYLCSRARYICVSSSEVTCLVLMSCASCTTGQNATSSKFAGRFTTGVLKRSGSRVRFTFIPGTIGLK